MQRTMNPEAQAVFQFWFPPGDDAGCVAPRSVWFVKDQAFDQQIRDRFAPLIGEALAGGLRSWDAEGAQAALARILLLDQFTRNAFRGTAQAFAGDRLALRGAQDMVDADEDLALAPFQRAFVYMPFEHAEDMAMQDQAVALFSRLAKTHPALNDMLNYAQRHREVIARFGRFPHRNAILGRPSSEEEQAFLLQPGSGF